MSNLANFDKKVLGTPFGPFLALFNILGNVINVNIAICVGPYTRNAHFGKYRIPSVICVVRNLDICVQLNLVITKFGPLFF